MGSVTCPNCGTRIETKSFPKPEISACPNGCGFRVYG